MKIPSVHIVARMIGGGVTRSFVALSFLLVTVGASADGGDEAVYDRSFRRPAMAEVMLVEEDGPTLPEAGGFSRRVAVTSSEAPNDFPADDELRENDGPEEAPVPAPEYPELVETHVSRPVAVPAAPTRKAAAGDAPASESAFALIAPDLLSDDTASTEKSFSVLKIPAPTQALPLAKFFAPVPAARSAGPGAMEVAALAMPEGTETQTPVEVVPAPSTAPCLRGMDFGKTAPLVRLAKKKKAEEVATRRHAEVAGDGTLAADDIDLTLIRAVRLTLSCQPDIRIQDTYVRAAAGTLQEQAGAFDWNLGLDVSGKRTHETDRVRTDSVTTDAELSKTTRMGLEVAPYATLSRQDARDASAPVNTGSAGLRIKLPLLRGLGVAATGALEIAAKHDLRASRETRLHETMQAVQSTADAYWTHVAALAVLRIRIESERRAQALLDKTEALINAGDRPAMEKLSVQANLEQKASRRIEAEQDLITTRLQLLLASGLAYDRVHDLPLPSEDFPSPPPLEALPNLPPVHAFTDLAIARRRDLSAADEYVRSSCVLTEAARRGLLPRLDLSVGAGVNGGDTGSGLASYVESPGRNRNGTDWEAGFSLGLPLGNNVRKGQLEQQQALLARNRLQRTDLARAIQSAVHGAWSGVQNAVKALERASRSVRSYTEAVVKETQKYELGDATVLDVMDMEDRLAEAREAEVQARKTYAEAILSLRFETGTLLSVRGDEALLDDMRLTTVPLPDMDGPAARRDDAEGMRSGKHRMENANDQ